MGPGLWSRSTLFGYNTLYLKKNSVSIYYLYSDFEKLRTKTESKCDQILTGLNNGWWK